MDKPYKCNALRENIRLRYYSHFLSDCIISKSLGEENTGKVEEDLEKDVCH